MKFCKLHTNIPCAQDVGELLALKARDRPETTDEEDVAAREARGLPVFPEGTVQVRQLGLCEESALRQIT